jgi:deoxycytidine triphosphate deaminase
MIYCDHQIEKAIRERRLIIDPIPEPSQFDSTSLNLKGLVAHMPTQRRAHGTRRSPSDWDTR